MGSSMSRLACSTNKSLLIFGGQAAARVAAA
jgi:hypothetical protein